MIYIYYTFLNEENHKILLKNELPKFSADFIKKITRFRKWQDAQLSLLGRMLLFKSIKEIYNLEFSPKSIVYNDYGKPYFKGNPVHFSISHSGEIVVCAVNDHSEIGIDIEKMSDRNIVDFEPLIDQKEWLKISTSENPKISFYDFWTKKEATIKVYGEGFGNDFIHFETLNNTLPIKTVRFYYKKIEIDKSYMCHLVCKTDLIDTRVVKITF